MATSTTRSTSWRMSVHGVARRDLLVAGGERPYRGQAEQEPAYVRPVGDAAPSARRAAEVGCPEVDLLEEPQPEHEHRRQLDHRDEEDYEHEGEHARAWIKQDVAAQHRGNGARRADRGHLRVGAEQHLPP